MISRCIFIEKIATLTPDRFLDYFLTRNNVAYPNLPEATEENLANAKKVLDNQFDLAGERHVFPDRFSWKQNPSRDKEWQIAHHKFYFAVDLIHAYRHYQDEAYLKKWISLLEAWIDEMGSGYITLSDAHVEAKRIEHWVYSFILLRNIPCRSLISPQFLRKFLERISTETLYISEHLKPVRNHRTFQLFTVFLVGVLFPEFRLHAYFLETGKDKLTENLLTDFLPDGIHVELSTHYHQLVLETALSFVELAQLNGIVPDGTLLLRIHRALEFSMFMQWPNGEIPLINDSDNGNHLELLRRGSRLFQDNRLLWAATLGQAGAPPKEVSKHFDPSGYFVLSNTWGEDPAVYANRQHLFYDCARLGEGSHSHYDLFSFCYYVNGEPAVIDPGRYTYSSDFDPRGIDWRKEFKSTVFHNTVAIDRKDQTRYLSRTKHGPEIEMIEKGFFLGKGSDWISAKAKSSEYTPLHKRLLIYMLREYLFIFDQIDIEDGKAHECALRFHLSEKWSNRISLDQGGSEVVVRSPLLEIRSYRAAGLEARMERGWVSRKYGVKTEGPVATMIQTSAQPLFFCSLLAPRRTDAKDPVVTAMNLMTPSEGNVLLFRVDGIREGKAFSDGFLFQRRGVIKPFQSEGITFRGRFLAFRRDGRGKVVHLFGEKVEQIEIEGGPSLRIGRPEDIEW